MSAVFLLDGAQLCASMGKYQKAIQWLMNYSEHPKASQLDYATFLVGYEYDAHLKQPMTAEKYYRAVIEKYPESQWAKSANQSLQWLGLSDDEIFKKLEEINAPLP
jgi:TolA-binding protein